MAGETSNQTQILPHSKPGRSYSNTHCDRGNLCDNSLVVGSENGYRLFGIDEDGGLEVTHSIDDEEPILVERLFNSSLVATVPLSAPYKLHMWHTRKNVIICRWTYTDSVLSVRMNRERLVLLTETELSIHDLKSMELIHTIMLMDSNPTGLCAFSMDVANCLLAYSASRTKGDVQIFDAVKLESRIMILAHDSPLAALAFSASATMIATASQKGTLIRVFCSDKGQKLFEFRRGLARCVDISCLAFSSCDKYLCASSNTETVHVFKLDEPMGSPKRKLDSSWLEFLSPYLPYGDVFIPDRAFAVAHLPVSGIKNTATITTWNQRPRLLVATAEGRHYVYNIDPKVGGELELCKNQHINIARDRSKKKTDSSAEGGEVELMAEAASAATQSPSEGPSNNKDDEEEKVEGAGAATTEEEAAAAATEWPLDEPSSDDEYEKVEGTVAAIAEEEAASAAAATESLLDASSSDDYDREEVKLEGAVAATAEEEGAVAATAEEEEAAAAATESPHDDNDDEESEYYDDEEGEYYDDEEGEYYDEEGDEPSRHDDDKEDKPSSDYHDDEQGKLEGAVAATTNSPPQCNDDDLIAFD